MHVNRRRMCARDRACVGIWWERGRWISGRLKTVIRQAGTSSMHIAGPHVHRIRGAHDSVGTSRRVPLCGGAATGR